MPALHRPAIPRGRISLHRTGLPPRAPRSSAALTEHALSTRKARRRIAAGLRKGSAAIRRALRNPRAPRDPIVQAGRNPAQTARRRAPTRARARASTIIVRRAGIAPTSRRSAARHRRARVAIEATHRSQPAARIRLLAAAIPLRHVRARRQAAAPAAALAELAAGHPTVVAITNISRVLS